MAKAAKYIVLLGGELCKKKNCPAEMGCWGKDENRGIHFVCDPQKMAKAAKIKILTRAQSAQLRHLKVFI